MNDHNNENDSVIDFAREKAHMTYGDIGIKVWIYKGDIFAAKKTA